MSNSRLEKAFDLGYNKYLEDQFILIKHIDFPTRKQAKQFPDRIILSKDQNYAIEIKYTSKERLRFRRFKKHQINFLKSFKEKEIGEAFFLVSLNDFEIVMLIDINAFLSFKQALKYASFTPKHLDQLNYTKMRAKKLRKNYRLDLSLLLNENLEYENR